MRLYFGIAFIEIASFKIYFKLLSLLANCNFKIECLKKCFLATMKLWFAVLS